MATKTAAKGVGGKRKAATKEKASESGQKVRELERQLQESKDELEAMRKKARAVETQANAAERPSEGATGKIRCPRCSGPMTEYDHAVVRADRCDNCQGIFFDNGELEQVVEKAIKDHDGQTQGSWFSSLFGRREKAKTT